MKKLTLLVLPILLSSCELDEPSSAVLDSLIFISVEDNGGSSLLYKDIKSSEVDVFYLIGDQWEREDKGGRYAFPENFGFEVQRDTDTLMRMFLNYHENPSLTVIDWGDGNYDTIQAEYDMGSNHTILERAFHQGEQIPYDTARKMTLLTLVRE